MMERVEEKGRSQTVTTNLIFVGAPWEIRLAVSDFDFCSLFLPSGRFPSGFDGL